MNVKVLRMNTGEEVIYSEISEDENSIEVEHPLVAIPNAQGQVGFAPWSTLAKDENTIKVSKEYIVYIADVNDELIEKYEDMFSPIKTPSSKLIL